MVAALELVAALAPDFVSSVLHRSPDITSGNRVADASFRARADDEGRDATDPSRPNPTHRQGQAAGDQALRLGRRSAAVAVLDRATQTRCPGSRLSSAALPRL